MTPVLRDASFTWVGSHGFLLVREASHVQDVKHLAYDPDAKPPLAYASYSWGSKRTKMTGMRYFDLRGRDLAMDVSEFGAEL